MVRYNICQISKKVSHKIPGETNFATRSCRGHGATHPHVVERYAHSVAEVLAEQRDLGVALAEVVKHDELGARPHADVDGLGSGAVGETGGVKGRRRKAQCVCVCLCVGSFQVE